MTRIEPEVFSQLRQEGTHKLLSPFANLLQLYSRSFSSSERNYDTTLRECLAIVWSIEHFEHVATDQASLNAEVAFHLLPRPLHVRVLDEILASRRKDAARSLHEGSGSVSHSLAARPHTGLMLPSSFLGHHAYPSARPTRRGSFQSSFIVSGTSIIFIALIAIQGWVLVFRPNATNRLYLEECREEDAV